MAFKIEFFKACDWVNCGVYISKWASWRRSI